MPRTRRKCHSPSSLTPFWPILGKWRGKESIQCQERRSFCPPPPPSGLFQGPFSCFLRTLSSWAWSPQLFLWHLMFRVKWNKGARDELLLKMRENTGARRDTKNGAKTQIEAESKPGESFLVWLRSSQQWQRAKAVQRGHRVRSAISQESFHLPSRLN